MKAALVNGLCPIVCCDDTMRRRVAGKKVHWVVSRILADLHGLTNDEICHVTVAYEPSWAIGTGESADQNKRRKVVTLFARRLVICMAMKLQIMFEFSMEEV